MCICGSIIVCPDNQKEQVLNGSKQVSKVRPHDHSATMHGYNFAISARLHAQDSGEQRVQQHTHTHTRTLKAGGKWTTNILSQHQASARPYTRLQQELSGPAARARGRTTRTADRVRKTAELGERVGGWVGVGGGSQ